MITRILGDSKPGLIPKEIVTNYFTEKKRVKLICGCCGGLSQLFNQFPVEPAFANISIGYAVHQFGDNGYA